MRGNSDAIGSVLEQSHKVSACTAVFQEQTEDLGKNGSVFTEFFYVPNSSVRLSKMGFRV